MRFLQGFLKGFMKALGSRFQTNSGCRVRKRFKGLCYRVSEVLLYRGMAPPTDHPGFGSHPDP